jgi:hypothetical protein
MSRSQALIGSVSTESLDADIEIDIYPPDPNYDVAERPWIPSRQTPYIIVNANLVCPRESKVHDRMTLHIADGKVHNVAVTVLNDLQTDFYFGEVKAVRIDASKYFICPGLIDCERSTTLLNFFYSLMTLYLSYLYIRPRTYYGCPRKQCQYPISQTVLLMLIFP